MDILSDTFGNYIKRTMARLAVPVPHLLSSEPSQVIATTIGDRNEKKLSYQGPLPGLRLI
jgi:hypothetical protein